MKSDSFLPSYSLLIVATTDCRQSDLSKGTPAVTYVDPAFLSGNDLARAISNAYQVSPLLLWAATSIERLASDR